MSKIIPQRHSLLDHLFGRVPQAWNLRCEDCDYKERLWVSKTCMALPYSGEDIGVRPVNALPKICPKCGGKRLTRKPGVSPAY